MKRIQNEHIICAGFGFCALNSAAVLIVQRPLPREMAACLIVMTITFGARAPNALNDPRPDMQSDLYTWQIISLIPSVSLMIFFVLKVGWWLIALLAAVAALAAHRVGDQHIRLIDAHDA